MANHIYFILSNNKEKGPYSLEELLQFSLKPDDLIWVEGGTSWRSPSEIETLRPHLNIPENNPQRMATNSSRIFISYPKNTNATTTAVASLMPEMTIDSSSATLENEEEPTAESLEMKADKIYQRVLAYNNEKQQSKESKVAEGANTLQELKQDYSSWHLKKKKRENSRKNRKRLLTKAGIAGIIVSGIFIAVQNIRVGEKKTSTPPGLFITNSTSPVASERLTNLTSDDVSNSEQNITTVPVAKDTVLSAPVTKSKELSVDEFIDSVRQAMTRQDRR